MWVNYGGERKIVSRWGEEAECLEGISFLPFYVMLCGHYMPTLGINTYQNLLLAQGNSDLNLALVPSPLLMSRPSPQFSRCDPAVKIV